MLSSVSVRLQRRVLRLSCCMVLLICVMVPCLGRAAAAPTAADVQKFAKTLAVNFYDFDERQANNWPMPLAPYFTAQTLQELIDSWQASGLLQNIKTHHLKVSPSLHPDEPVVVRHEGEGRWQVKLVVAVAADGSEWHRKQDVLLNMLIQQGKQGKLLVTQLIARKHRCVGKDLQWIISP